MSLLNTFVFANWSFRPLSCRFCSGQGSKRPVPPSIFPRVLQSMAASAFFAVAAGPFMDDCFVFSHPVFIDPISHTCLLSSLTPSKYAQTRNSRQLNAIRSLFPLWPKNYQNRISHQFDKTFNCLNLCFYPTKILISVNPKNSTYKITNSV